MKDTKYPIEEELWITPKLVRLLRSILKTIPKGDYCNKCKFRKFRKCILFSQKCKFHNLEWYKCEECKDVKG